MLHNWLNKSDSSNFDINTAYLISNLNTGFFNDIKPYTIFSHVPKAAGTSLESVLAKNFLMSETLHINAPDLNKQPDVLKLKKNHPKLICGHHPIHGYLYQALPDQPLFHLTQLRDPVDRVISYYNYIYTKKDHPLHRHALDKSLTDFILNTPSPELANGQAKRFSGYLHSEVPSDEVLLTKAKTTLDQCFSLVLTTCLFDEGLLLLKNRINLKDIFYRRSNVSTKIIKRADLSEQELKLIKNNNQADLALYDWAKIQCLELINQELTTEMIVTFKTKNSQWNKLIKD